MFLIRPLNHVREQMARRDRPQVTQCGVTRLLGRCVPDFSVTVLLELRRAGGTVPVGRCTRRHRIGQTRTDRRDWTTSGHMACDHDQISITGGMFGGTYITLALR